LPFEAFIIEWLRVEQQQLKRGSAKSWFNVVGRLDEEQPG
jgi:hypothetical protein